MNNWPSAVAYHSDRFESELKYGALVGTHDMPGLITNNWLVYFITLEKDP